MNLETNGLGIKDYIKYKHKRIGGRKGKMRLAHHLVWEEHNGEIPEGYEIHHKDNNPQNNHILNLMCLTRQDHLRHHSPYWFRQNGEWKTYCRYCKESLTEETRSKLRWSRCKKCHSDNVQIRKYNKRQQDSVNTDI